jgi:hypothetical protein
MLIILDTIFIYNFNEGFKMDSKQKQDFKIAIDSLISDLLDFRSKIDKDLDFWDSKIAISDILKKIVNTKNKMFLIKDCKN